MAIVAEGQSGRVYLSPNACLLYTSRSTLHGSMVIISHQERILQIADEIAVISGGELTQQGKAQEILPELMRGAGVAACCRQKEAFA